MYFRLILSAAGLAVAFALAPGQAEVLAVDSTFAINGTATISYDTFDSDRGTLAVTAVPELPTWATTLLSLTGFGR
jgi:hypothetical protein